MNKQQILESLNPDWWDEITDPWYNNQVATQINFTNTNGVELTYLSNAPYQSNGMWAQPSGINVDLLINQLMVQAAQELENLHCASVIGYTKVKHVYGGQA